MLIKSEFVLKSRISFAKLRTRLPHAIIAMISRYHVTLTKKKIMQLKDGYYTWELPEH